LASQDWSSPTTPATATFSQGKWTVALGGTALGSLPELPDFPDYFQLLVAQASAAGGKTRPKAQVSQGDEHGTVLMPALLETLRTVEKSWPSDDRAAAARCFAWLTFQMNDRLEVAPLIPARALALLAIGRARGRQTGIEEEILLAHALGYT